MKRSLAACMCIGGFAFGSASAADEPWFKLLEAKDGGYMATGKLNGGTWFFRIPGQKIGTLGDHGGRQPMLIVDGVPVTVLAVPPEDYGRGARDPLAAQRKYEQDYQRKTIPGVEISELEMCKQSQFPHGGWVAKLPPRADDVPSPGMTEYRRFPYQVYVTYQVSDVVLMINSAYGDDESKKAAAAKLDAICRSFLRDKP